MNKNLFAKTPPMGWNSYDYYDTSVTAALMIVDEMKKQGYEFVTVEEILFD